MIKKYVLMVFGFCAILYIIIVSRIISPSSSSGLWHMYIPILLVVSAFLFGVKKYRYIQIINSLCISFILYGILFLLVERAGISTGWNGLGAIMYAFYAMLITLVTNLIWWIRKDKKSN
ncbi:hypothetical protein [Sphingobacterium sp. MYb382]|uniref:hypothetical protein n=1 Tax=Sphingobacterium sp. MYb382 TaxID=2745278 RepID=UPI0030AE8DE3